MEIHYVWHVARPFVLLPFVDTLYIIVSYITYIIQYSEYRNNYTSGFVNGRAR